MSGKCSALLGCVKPLGKRFNCSSIQFLSRTRPRLVEFVVVPVDTNNAGKPEGFADIVEVATLLPDSGQYFLHESTEGCVRR